ncbi:MAG TPA: hypothetical protein VIL84_06685 [Devosiaceae bacterium]
MTLALKDQWIWDFWLARDGEDWHVYFLKADKSLGDPELRHFNVSQGHAKSRDLKTWTHLGTSFAPSKGPAWDDYTTWTGSVIQGPDGVWHLFYTGTNRAEAGMKQRIGHATSTDMHNFERVGDGLCLDISGPDYEEYAPGHWHDRAMRDPYVIKDPDGPGYLMYFTARQPGMAEPNAGGTIGFATSPDLYEWTLQPPVYRGGMFGQMEVPEVIEIDGRWYCLFCTSGSHWSKAYAQGYPGTPVTGTHYLIADNPRGPWTVAPGPFLDGAEPCSRYSGKVVKTDAGLKFLGFVHNPGGVPFVGEVADPVDVIVGDDGLLRLSDAPASARRAG